MSEQTAAGLVDEPSSKPKKDTLYLQVLLGVVVGIGLGYFRPDWSDELKVLADIFLRLIKMVIAPLVFLTVVGGINSASKLTGQRGDQERAADGTVSLRRVGRIGLTAFIYFEIMTTLALVLGLVVVRWVRPGAGINARLSDLEPLAAAAARAPLTWQEHTLAFVPQSFVGAFAQAEILQILVLAILVGVALVKMGDRAQPVRVAVEESTHVLFTVIGLIMRFAPLGALGAMAYTVGHFGVSSLANLMRLMATFYLTSIVFVVVILGGVCAWCGVNILRLIRYLKDELIVVLGTSSSESALPQLMTKMTKFGCKESIVRLVIPTGYSFNLDGTSIYLTMAAVFVAQALNLELSFGEEMSILFVLLLTSKGAAAVTGGGFATLTATLESSGRIPVNGLSLIFGIDRFMSEARALTNLVGNAVAAIVVSKLHRGFDRDAMLEALNEVERRG